MAHCKPGVRLRCLALAAVLFLTLFLPANIGFHRSGALAQGETSLVRVLLTRLKLTDRLDAELDGSYSLEPGRLAFQRGSRITISSANGTLMLYYEGMAMDAGQQLVLRRHAIATNEENGLRLNGDYALYAGELTVSIRDGALRAVLQLPMEEYLLGVVPYEMSDSFPLEALKAQAVTARTYALKRVGGSQDYDVVDNTNDQVFKGFISDNQRAITAIKETEGVVGFFNGKLADCYYSASNGGQTELIKHVWSGDSKDISLMKDDPYDLQNPMSIVKSFSVMRTPPENQMDDPLAPMLKSALSAQLAALGYDSDPAFIRVFTVDSVSVLTPKYDKPSRLMTKIRFDVEVMARKPAQALPSEAESYLVPPESPSLAPSPTPQAPQWTAMEQVEKVFTIELDIFPDVSTALDLNINGSGNELVTVRETKDSFVIESRRYGHGVGLSQRGAEWMALQDGWTFDKILKFYFPDMKLMKMTAQSTLQPPIDAAFLATPGPPATPTPRPTLMPVTQTPAPGQWIVKVTQIDENSSLNMRSEPSLTASVVRLLFYGQRLLVLQELEGGWLKVKTDAMEGYVMASFVEKEE